MRIPSVADILARADALFEHDGNVWDEREWALWRRVAVQPFIDGEHRIAYLAQAKPELMQEVRK
jgi:hypothetical protein